MSRVRYRLEVWDRDNSVRLAYAATASELRRRRVLKGEETISARITLHDYAADRVEEGCILRVQEIGEPTSYVLGRLTSVERSRAPNGALTCEISADALWMDLRQGLVRQIMSDGRPLYTWGLVDVSPLEWIRDVILPGYEGTGVTFEVGVVELATPVTLSFDDTTPLEALRMLEQACTEAEGAAELQLRPNATGTGYIVDLLHRVGATSGGAELRYRKNIVGLRRRREEYPVATRVRARGSGLLTLADAEWEIDAVGGTGGAHVLTFAGMHPVFEDGAFVDPDGPLYFFVPGKAAYPITASDATAGTLTVDDTGLQAPVSGDVGWIATDATGTRLDYLESPAGVALYGVRIGTLRAEDVPDAINTLPNGDFSEWSGGLPIGWSAEGSAVIQESTDHARRGGKSAHVTAAADGEGIVSEAVPVLQTEARPYTGMHVELLVVSGQVRIELRHSNGTVYPVQQRPLSTGLGVELELSANVHDEPLPAGTLQLAVVAHGGAAEWYLDAAMITPILAADVPGWVKRSGAWELWRRTAQHLATARQPRLEYDVQVVDLHRIAPDVFRFDAIELGDDVRLIDPDIARETVRVVEIEEEMLSRGVQRVVLAPSPELRLHDPYRETPPGSRYAGSVAPSPAPADVPRVLSVAAQLDPTDGKLYLSPLGNSRVATLELYLKTSRTGAYPSAPTATINGRQGAFPGQTLAAARYFKVVPKDGRGVAGDAWEGGGDSYAPTASARAATVSNGTAADAYVTPDSPIGEMLRVHVRDSDGEGAPVWSLVQDDGDPTPLYVADGTEVGPDAWFYDGSTYAQKLKALSLLRDQLRRLYVQAEGQLTALRSTWVPIPLELRAQPWVESVTGAWTAAGDKIDITVLGGAHCQSARLEWSKDGFNTVASQVDISLADGQRATASYQVPTEDQERPWAVRAIPFNGPLVAGVVSGLAGVPHESAVPERASLLPVAIITALGQVGTSNDWRWRITGVDAAGSSQDLEYRAAWHYGDTPFPGWPDWSPLPPAGVTIDLGRHPYRSWTLGAQVRDRHGRVSVDAWAYLPPGLPGIDPTTGKLKWSEVEDDDGNRPQDRATRGAPPGTQIGFFSDAETIESEALAGGIGYDHLTQLEAGGYLDLTDDKIIGIHDDDDDVVRPGSALWRQATSRGQNLLGSDAGREHTLVGNNYIYEGFGTGVNGFPIDLLALRPGQHVSGSLEVESQDGNPGLAIRFYDLTGTLLAEEYDVPQATGSLQRAKIENMVVPQFAAYINFQTANVHTASGPVRIRYAMLNRGPVALPFEQPPGRPARERIHVWDGTLRPTVTASDGAAARLLPKGVLHGLCWNGNAIVYEQPYQNTPIPIVFQGPTMDERAVWWLTVDEALSNPNSGSARTPGGRVKQVWSVVASASGFTPRLVLANIGGAPSPKSIAFSSSPLTEGQVSAPVTPGGSPDTPSVGDRYTVTYSADVLRGGTTGDVQAYVTVAVEVSLNGGAYAEMGTDVLTITIPNGFATGSGSGSFQFVSAIGGGDDNVRIRFKQLEFSAPTPLGGGNVTPGSLSWSALPTAQYANATPDGEADALPFVIIPQS